MPKKIVPCIVCRALWTRGCAGCNPPCLKPPVGWWCSRGRGHEGPCAARPILSDAERESQAWAAIAQWGEGSYERHSKITFYDPQGQMARISLHDPELARELDEQTNRFDTKREMTRLDALELAAAWCRAQKV